MTEMVYHTEFDHLLGQKAKRPAGMPFRSLRASQQKQAGFLFAIEFARIARTRFFRQSRLQALLAIAATDMKDRCRSTQKRLGYLLIGLVLFLAVIGQQQNAGTGQDAGGGMPRRDHLQEVGAFFARKMDGCMFCHNDSIPRKSNL